MAIEGDKESPAVVSPTDRNKIEEKSGKVLPANSGQVQKPKPNVSTIIKKVKDLSPKTKIIIIALFVVLLITAALIIWVAAREEPVEKVAATDACSSDTELLKNYSNAFNNNDISNMASIKDMVMQKEDFENDPNCLFITTQTYILLDDAANAQTQHDLLSAKFNIEAGYAEDLLSVARTPQAIKEDIDFLNSRVSDVEQRSYLGGSIRE